MKKIPLRNKKQEIIAFTLVDDSDFDYLNQWRWNLSGRGYVERREHRSEVPNDVRRLIPMHRVILGLTRGDPVEADHINRNKLDNQRINLRKTTHAQNLQNQSSRVGSTSRFRGVTWFKRDKRWRAQGYSNGTVMHLGYFENEIEAAVAARDFRLKTMTHSIEEETP